MFLATGSIIFNSPNKYQVNISIVRDCLIYDFPQAKIAWEALLDAGIEPGELILNSLKTGHGYKIQSHFRLESIRNSSENLMGESIVSNQGLISYQKVKELNITAVIPLKLSLLSSGLE